MGAEGWRTQDGRNLALSERQREVLALLARGYTNAEIGEALGMTLDGAKWHVSEIISKLGVANREEAAARWRQERRTAGPFRALASPSAWRWFLAGTGGFAAAALATFVIITMVRGSDDPSPAAVETPESASPTPAPTASPTPAPLTALEILHRSEQAMAAIPTFRVESIGWPPQSNGGVHGVEVREYSGTSTRLLHVPGYELPECPAAELRVPPFTRRSLGALAVYTEPGPLNRGASQPTVFEHLGEQTINGEEAWVIRYAFTYPSIETPVRVEDTEWIAKSDYRLLRQERDHRDDYGFIGQIVSVIRPVEAPTTECPVAPEHTIEQLTPLTTPRLSAD